VKFLSADLQHYPLDLTRLPSTWAVADVGELSKVVQPGFPSGKHNQDGRGVPHLRPMNISRAGVIDLADVKYVEDKDGPRLAGGDVLFNNTNSPALIGKTAVIQNARDWAFSNHMTRITPATGVMPSYLAHHLHYLWMSGYFRHRCVNHVNQASISSGPLSTTVPIAVAPIAEQERIVAAIEEQFSRLDAGVAALDRVRQNLKRMRAAVLHTAVTGRLVSHDANDEPAVRLMERLTDERAARGQRMLPQPLDGSTSLPPLPDAWVWANIGQLFDVFVGTTPSRDNARLWNGHIAWVSSGEVAFGRIRDTREKITDEGLGNPQTRLHPAGTVMLAMIGEGKTRGQAAILGVSAAHNQNCASIRVSETEISSEYIFYVLVERYERTRIMASGGNQPALNGERVRTIPVPLPPVAEQKRIVDAIERYESTFTVLDAFLSNARVRCDSLRSSILAKAFCGKLAPQDPADEPGSVLLERMVAKRASSNNGHKASRTRKPRRGVIA
jgi:type I restriction enzyme S subunit